MNALIRNSSELETYVVSVERVDEYATVAPEVGSNLMQQVSNRQLKQKAISNFYGYLPLS